MVIWQAGPVEAVRPTGERLKASRAGDIGCLLEGTPAGKPRGMRDVHLL